MTLEEYLAMDRNAATKSQVVRLASVGCDMALSEVYSKVVFEDEGEAPHDYDYHSS